jgi:hypothetical protein
MGVGRVETHSHPGERFENVIDSSLKTSIQRNERPTLASRLLFIVGLASAVFLGAASHEAAAQTRVSQIDTAQYSVALTAASHSRLGQYQATKPGSATFTVLGKLPATIDRNHTWTLTLHNPPGDKVSYVKTVYTRADAMIADGSVTFSVPFLAREAGQGLVEGSIEIRSCAVDGKCGIKLEEVALAIDIAAAPSGT